MQNDSKEFCNTFSTTLADHDKLLQDAQRRKLIEYIPLIVVLFMIAIIGIIGNILTISFYGFRVKRTTTFVLIRLLAIVDLIVCFLCFTTIASICVNIKFTSAILCKMMYFLDHWSMQSSVLILWIISIHRYRRICRPLRKQLTVKSATVAVVVTSGFSMIYCTHVFVTYNPVNVNISTLDASIPNVAGHYCTNTDDLDLKDVLFTFHAIDAMSVMFCFITFVFTYGNIWRTVREHNRTAITIQAVPSNPLRQNTFPFKHESVQMTSYSSREISSTDQFTAQIQSDHTTDTFAKLNANSEQSLGTIGHMTTVAIGAQKMQKSSNPPATVSRERNITLMMFAVTVGLVKCFTPYFIASVAMSSTTEDKLNTGMELALRFPFFNSVINPVIFCVFNSEYRRYLKEKFTVCSNK